MGWISAAGSVGRCAGPLWSVALYKSGLAGGESAISATAAATPVWLINGLGVALGSLIVLAAWHGEMLRQAASCLLIGFGGIVEVQFCGHFAKILWGPQMVTTCNF